MALPDPSWRVKTRPCPFYQQGRCMFAESCNFLHSASIVHAQEVASHKSAPLSVPEAGPSTPHIPPRVVIDSPKSIRSPTRSPRTTSLLLALRDVIGDPDEEEGEEENQDQFHSRNSLRSPPSRWSEALPTLVNNEGFGPYFQAEDDSFESEEGFPDEDYDTNWTAISDYNDENNDVNTRHQEALDQDNTPLLRYEDAPSEEEAARIYTAPLTEEPEGSVANSRQNRESMTSVATSASDLGNRSTRESSFDSGYAEQWKPPTPMPSSPPRSPSINSTFELLSSPFGAHSARILSPRLGLFMSRQHLSPTSTISPAIQEEAEPQDLGLDSPQEYHATHDIARKSAPDDVRESEHVDDAEEHEQEVDDQVLSEVSSSDEEDWFEQGHTLIWNGEHSTSVFVGTTDNAPADSNDVVLDSVSPSNPIQEEVNATIRRLSRSPVHFLESDEPQFFNDGPVADSSTAPGYSTAESVETESETFSLSEFPPVPTHHSAPISPDPGDTAFLAYLRSPPTTGPENDTLNSLYDIYSVIAPPADIIADSMCNAQLSPPPPEPTALSNSSTPASSLRERVFTPPPPARKQSSTITADSPTSLPSPITSLDSMSMGRASPFPQADFKSSSVANGSQSAPGQDVDVSRKIPFGFRSTFSLGRTSMSSSRSGGRPAPPSPLENEIPTTKMAVSESEPLSKSPKSASSPAPATKGLKPLRLSALFNANSASRSTLQSRMSTTSLNSFHPSGNTNSIYLSSPSVSSRCSLSQHHLLSSTRSSAIPLHRRTTLSSSDTRSSPSPSSPTFFSTQDSLDGPRTAPLTSWRDSINYSRPSSRLSEPLHQLDEDQEDDTTGQYRRDPYNEAICRPMHQVPHTAPASRVPSALHHHAIATPRPTLMFAIASDNVEQVREVLESGDAGPNDTVGPLSALEFTLTNDKLANKLEIVKTLLAYGADPTIAKNKMAPASSSQAEVDNPDSQEEPPRRSLMDEMDPATRYYVERADAVHTRRTSALIHRSFFRPLTRVRYELIGQDRALEQLFRVLSMHSRQLAVAPMVVMLCGPSGHGKSLLARKFGSLLDVPTHTVNMTTLKSTHDLWQSYSMSPYETPTTCTLAEFLVNNEGKRCVVVLDEIEKTADQNTLFSLLMPWELGRCAFEASSRHIDVRNVIWLGTSNIGHDLVFEHREARKNPEDLMSREEYVELMALLRPRVSEKLGASVMSRITTVLPFVPFTLEEKRAICSEALYTLGGDAARTLSSSIVETVINTALTDYCAVEGARSLYRATSSQLVDII